jgi:cellulose synthase/poly-beta-1,6-N-acetylglucosamine synthase-like glycosyltransferase
MPIKDEELRKIIEILVNKDKEKKKQRYLKNQFKESSKKMKISVIVATYNRIDALDFVLQSLENQTDCNFEVLIADDGSKFDTKDFINSFRWHWRSHL